MEHEPDPTKEASNQWKCFSNSTRSTELQAKKTLMGLGEENPCVSNNMDGFMCIIESNLPKFPAFVHDAYNHNAEWASTALCLAFESKKRNNDAEQPRVKQNPILRTTGHRRRRGERSLRTRAARSGVDVPTGEEEPPLGLLYSLLSLVKDDPLISDVRSSEHLDFKIWTRALGRHCRADPRHDVICLRGQRPNRILSLRKLQVEVRLAGENDLCVEIRRRLPRSRSWNPYR
ncbi:hypothetical protein FE257_012398 [Aspergillus nanangensis]|uniref:Uncharacterized protein n=1 Tax=Aspergillus nanangensis TaxID=2582783 RepID=A0AAD4CV31_ASPNN|nr:hypothetical protein FE257_012398 [Aspergillus nanangensis]